MNAGRVIGCHFRRVPLFGAGLLVGLAALVFVSSCNHDIPVVTVGPKPPTAQATIYGVVRGPRDTSAGQRTVDIVNVATGERRQIQTSSTGAFTVELPAGRYHLDLRLREGETLLKSPADVELDHGQIKSHIEFVLGEARLVHPHGPAYRVENGLGSPIA